LYADAIWSYDHKIEIKPYVLTYLLYTSVNEDKILNRLTLINKTTEVSNSSIRQKMTDWEHSDESRCEM